MRTTFNQTAQIKDMLLDYFYKAAHTIRVTAKSVSRILTLKIIRGVKAPNLFERFFCACLTKLRSIGQAHLWGRFLVCGSQKPARLATLQFLTEGWSRRPLYEEIASMDNHAIGAPAPVAMHLLSFENIEHFDHCLTRANSILEVMAESFAMKSNSHFNLCMIAIDEITQAKNEVKRMREGIR